MMLCDIYRAVKTTIERQYNESTDFGKTSFSNISNIFVNDNRLWGVARDKPAIINFVTQSLIWAGYCALWNQRI